MKNVNYNLIKSLHNSLDDMWRLEKFYVKDAKAAKCHSEAFMKKMLDSRKKEVEQLAKEIKMRIEAGIFD
jgi:hypothetical protein